MFGTIQVEHQVEYKIKFQTGISPISMKVTEASEASQLADQKIDFQ